MNFNFTNDELMVFIYIATLINFIFFIILSILVKCTLNNQVFLFKTVSKIVELNK